MFHVIAAVNAKLIGDSVFW